MRLEAFTVHDSKASAYLQPFFAPSRGVAIRMFTDACNDPEHQFFRHPEDFTLFSIGVFYQETGQWEAIVPAVPLGKALDYVKSSGQMPLFVQE